MAYFAGLSGYFFGGLRERNVSASSVVPKGERRVLRAEGVVNVGWLVRVYFSRIVVSNAPVKDQINKELGG